MNDPRDKALAAALMRVKRQRALERRATVQKIPPGMGINQAGPKPDTNATPNVWPTDGDNS